MTQIISSTCCLFCFRFSLSKYHPELILLQESFCAIQTFEKENEKGGERKDFSRSTISNNLKSLFFLFLRNGNGKGWLNPKRVHQWGSTYRCLFYYYLNAEIEIIYFNLSLEFPLAANPKSHYRLQVMITGPQSVN